MLDLRNIIFKWLSKEDKFTEQCNSIKSTNNTKTSIEACHAPLYHWIDALKGIAMLLVIMIHSGAGKELSGILKVIGSKGNCGVVLFFLISGFLIYKSLYSFFSKTEHSALSSLLWIKQKIIRFAPLFYLATICGVLMGGHKYWLGSKIGISTGNITAHFLFVHGLYPRYCDSIVGVEWYIGVLVIFICIAPLLFKYFNSFSKSLFLFSISLGMAYFVNKYLNTLTPFENKEDMRVYKSFVNSFGFFENFPTLCLGVVLYYANECLKEIKINRILVSYTLLFLSAFFIYGNLHNLNKLFGINWHTLWALPFALLIISQILHTNTIICNKLFQIIGVYSWPIYLFHFCALKLYNRYNFIKLENPIYSWGLKFFVVLFISLLISFILVKFFEKPVIDLLSRKKTIKQLFNCIKHRFSFDKDV